MKKRIVIVGGGISGLVAGYVFRQYDSRRQHDIKILECGILGGEFLVGGLKYIHRTDEIVRLFNKLHILYSGYTVRGGIMLHGKVLPYPRCFEGMNPEQRSRIRRDHYVKTRCTAPGPWAERSMNDPASVKPRKAIRCDFGELVQMLAKPVEIVSRRFIRADREYVYASRMTKLPYDFLIFTVPLWVIRENVWFYVPAAIAMKLNIAKVVPAKDVYAKWDYVYTPYTPGDCVHRFSSQDDGYVVEMNGQLKRLKLESDLSFIFPDGHYVERIVQNLKGHLLPLSQQLEWPDNVAPLGRFAQWEPRATMDCVLERAHDLVKKWGLDG